MVVLAVLKRCVALGACRLALLFALAFVAVPAAASDSEWSSVDAQGKVQVQLYFFWSEQCPHCREARPFIESLPQRFPWLTLHSLELSGQRENVALYVRMARALGQKAQSVPALLYCGRMVVGYDEDATTGEYLVRELQACRARLQNGPPEQAAAEPPPLSVPLLDERSLQELSLPALTVLLGALDSFNPCAFFVLLFLLSLLVHARSRARMLAIGGIFVFFSGLVYFLFMAAWLNVFLIVGELHWVTLGAGLLAVGFALVNIKDYFWFRHGVSLSIPERAKPGLFQRMRGIANADRVWTMIVGAVLLAGVANSYELLCTAGFPMVYTRILTLHDLAPVNYYLYLAFYNLVYIVPLAVIVLLFAVTLGSRKLKEREGRMLKLLSGMMMLGLGLVLIIAPDALGNVLVALALVLIALAVTFLLVRLSPIHES